jgi:chemotaxis family two-component system sensor kinase Cph1
VRLLSGLSDSAQLDGRNLEIRRGDGGLVHAAITARPRLYRDGRSDGHVIFIRDASEEVAGRTRLERKNAELESYVHSVSHDLRSPLVSLLGFTRLLRQDYDHVFDDTARHFADRIEQAGRTMNALIEDLLELSRIGASNEHRSLVDPRAVLLQLEAELKLRLEETGARLQIPDSPPLVLCDRTRLYQLFSNLVGNALQHMGPCADPVIEVAVMSERDRHVITVADRGRGIPADELERIFEVFRSASRKPPGSQSTGIGLAIVRKIARMHGGEAWAESQPGQGARFYVSLPRS